MFSDPKGEDATPCKRSIRSQFEFGGNSGPPIRCGENRCPVSCRVMFVRNRHGHSIHYLGMGAIIGTALMMSAVRGRLLMTGSRCWFLGLLADAPDRALQLQANDKQDGQDEMASGAIHNG